MYDILIVFAFLLPVAWYFGFRNGRQNKDKQQNLVKMGLSKSYFTGLNYLLNEQQDKAIDTFVTMLEVDSETVETHLALGNLFRRRGEVDRAIRIHQNLIARPSLSTSHRKMSLMELGYDYMAAGLLDRAENIFKELLQDNKLRAESLKQLLIIYQQTKDWQKAIDMAEKLRDSRTPEIRVEIAHYYCELAESSLFENAPREAVGFVKKALATDPKCIRAYIISGNVHISMGRYKQAIKNYRELLRIDVELLCEAVENIRNCFVHLNDRKGLLAFLEEAIEKGAGVTTMLVYAEEVQSQTGDREAAEYIATQLTRHPSIKGLLKLIQLHLKHANDSAKPSLLMLEDVVSKLLQNKPTYHCHHCGFDAKTLFWQCPGCKSWGSVKPIQGIEGE